MAIYTLLISLTFSLLFTACQPTPNAPLSPKLQQYAHIKENCEGLQTMPGISVPDELDEACRTFLRRLDKVNTIDNKVAHFSDDKAGAKSKGNPAYIRLQTDAHRQHRKAEVEYATFCDTINNVSLDAITHDKLSDVELTLTFPETIFSKRHYLYYQQQTAEQQQDPHYLAFEQKYALDLFKQGLTYLGQGQKKKALKKFKEADTLHNVQATYLIGIIYEAKHIDKAIKWHTKAVENGMKSARLNLARLYLRKHQPKEAQRLYHEAADDGDAYAQYILFKQYEKTDNTKTNTLAKEWLAKSAENGFPLAEYAYGKFLLKTHQNTAAKEWLLKAHTHGISASNTSLGAIYFQDKKYHKALTYLTLAADANAKYELAYIYEHGLGVDVNFYRAYMLYKKALELGRKKAKKDVARLAKLTTRSERAHYEADKQKMRHKQKELSLQNGAVPTLRNLRTKAMLLNIQGFVSLPLDNAHGFVVNSKDGKQFYIIDTKQKAHALQYQYISITAKSTTHAITISDNNGATIDIYQLIYLSTCKK